MDLPQHPNPWTTLSSRETYVNPWIRVREDQVLKPTGGPGIYGVVEYKNIAVGVVPVDDEGFTWLVGQWRYCHGRYEWEIPEGGCPPGESTAEAAKRELLEETGLVAEKITPLLTGLQLSNSTTNEVCDIFVATGLIQAQSAPEDTEQLEVLRLPLAEAIQMARDGRIRDSVSVLALLSLQARTTLKNLQSPFDTKGEACILAPLFPPGNPSSWQPHKSFSKKKSKVSEPRLMSSK